MYTLHTVVQLDRHSFINYRLDRIRYVLFGRCENETTAFGNFLAKTSRKIRNFEPYVRVYACIARVIKCNIVVVDFHGHR